MRVINEQAVEAATRCWSFQSHLNLTTDMRHSIAAYFDSLAAQGIMLVEQPTKPCEECDGDGIARGRGGSKRGYPCTFCKGSGTVPAEPVDVQELR